ncbi:unnamed protein product, partial [Meganyctiphanes norvegica]
ASKIRVAGQEPQIRRSSSSSSSSRSRSYSSIARTRGVTRDLPPPPTRTRGTTRDLPPTLTRHRELHRTWSPRKEEHKGSVDDTDSTINDKQPSTHDGKTQDSVRIAPHSSQSRYHHQSTSTSSEHAPRPTSFSFVRLNPPVPDNYRVETQDPPLQLSRLQIPSLENFDFKNHETTLEISILQRQSSENSDGEENQEPPEDISRIQRPSSENSDGEENQEPPEDISRIQSPSFVDFDFKKNEGKKDMEDERVAAYEKSTIDSTAHDIIGNNKYSNI